MTDAPMKRKTQFWQVRYQASSASDLHPSLPMFTCSWTNRRLLIPQQASRDATPEEKFGMAVCCLSYVRCLKIADYVQRWEKNNELCLMP